MRLVERFFEYVAIDSMSIEDVEECPSSAGQMFFARVLADELRKIGMHEVKVDENGYVMATLPSNFHGKMPVIGFIAHMDTSPDMTGRNVKPQIIKNYDGGSIALNKREKVYLTPEEFPELNKYIGQDLITTNGLTLLGADDKAGIAEIVTAMEHLIQNPSIKHGKIRICFTPDEEIGRGANKFDVKKFGADFAYTMDGGEIGELEYENFNAAIAKIIVKGRNVHPGYAYNKMTNSIEVASRLVHLIPIKETPSHSTGHEGFFHVVAFNGDVERTDLSILIRDFDSDHFESRKKQMTQWVTDLNDEFGQGTLELEIHDQYYNMRNKIEPVMHIVELAKNAMLQSGVTPRICPIRGGTDGARLSFMGLPTPNIFAGGHNFHGRYEFIPVQSMQKAVEVIVNIVRLATQQ